MATLLVALLPPIAGLAEKLGWVHMIQHTALMMVAAPLFVLGSPGSHMSAALPSGWSRMLWRQARRIRVWRLPYFQVSQPILIWLLFALTLWIWHVPVLYEGALRSRFVHDLQHLTFFLTAALFWQALLHPIRRRRLNQGLGVLYLFLASIHSTALGVLMALSPVVWYPTYESTAPAMGYPALLDQQIAGYIMWMPACMMYAAIAVALCASWLLGMRDPLPGRREGHVQGA
jgi:cytochrome c oxidase assembly factor CtaG